MKIGIISDTHIKKSMDNFIDLLETHLKEVDLIIHAGDFISDGVVSFFNDKSFIGVWGNVDSRGIKTLLNEKEIFNVEGYRIGVSMAMVKVNPPLIEPFPNSKRIMWT